MWNYAKTSKDRRSPQYISGKLEEARILQERVKHRKENTDNTDEIAFKTLLISFADSLLEFQKQFTTTTESVSTCNLQQSSPLLTAHNEENCLSIPSITKKEFGLIYQESAAKEDEFEANSSNI